MMDIQAELDAIDRVLEDDVRDGDDVRVQTIAQTYSAPIDDVWDALTTAERIPRWFLPVSGDLRLGGRYQFEGQAGGVVESCDAPNSFGVTWEFGGGITWLTVRLTEVGGGTRVELVHVAKTDDIGDEMWQQFGPSATGIGWDSALFGLAQHLTTGEVRPENSQEWLMGEDGLAFQRGSADRWAAAHVASGADEETARAAADTTFAAYTGAAAGPMD